MKMQSIEKNKDIPCCSVKAERPVKALKGWHGRKKEVWVANSSSTIKKIRQICGNMLLKSGVTELERQQNRANHSGDCWIYPFPTWVSAIRVQAQKLFLRSHEAACTQGRDVLPPGVPVNGSILIRGTLGPQAAFQHGVVLAAAGPACPAGRKKALGTCAACSLQAHWQGGM